MGGLWRVGLEKKPLITERSERLLRLLANPSNSREGKKVKRDQRLKLLLGLGLLAG